jgi:hypothetical protein
MRAVYTMKIGISKQHFHGYWGRLQRLLKKTGAIALLKENDSDEPHRNTTRLCSISD